MLVDWIGLSCQWVDTIDGTRGRSSVVGKNISYFCQSFLAVVLCFLGFGFGFTFAPRIGNYQTRRNPTPFGEPDRMVCFVSLSA